MYIHIQETATLVTTIILWADNYMQKRTSLMKGLVFPFALSK